MSEISTTILLITFVVVVLGGIPYLIWMIVTAFKKRWRKLGLQFAIPIAILALLTLGTRLLNRAAHRSELREVYDARVDFGDPIYTYDSERSYHGDGYSIQVYKLPDSLRKRFESADERLRTKFPKRPHYRDHWDTVHWREAPFDPAFDPYLSFALNSYFPDQPPRLAIHFANIRSALQQPGTFYAFFKYDHGSTPGNIDMFIVDLERGRIYEINHNT